MSRAILVNVIPREQRKEKALRDFDELIRLVQTYGGIVILKVVQKRGRPSAKTFIGEGKAQELALLVKSLKADLIIINDFLKANQSNNLVNIIPCEVMDRFELILTIFEKHAVSPEAKLQIELMRMKYEFPKLFGKGAALSQQRGGIRVGRGPGEKLLEFKRRHLRDRIQSLERKLEQFVKIRKEQQARRRRENFQTVALVGYTNSGKSTLLRAMTKKQNIVVEDKYFSTLDTRLGHVFMPNMPRILLSDTIGFIQNLPPLLFSTFLATLEETKQADLILHVIDASDPRMMEKIEAVEHILAQLGCGEKKQIFVFNKIDLVPHNFPSDFLESTFAAYEPVFISAEKKLNLPELIQRIEQSLRPYSSTDRTQASGA